MRSRFLHVVTVGLLLPSLSRPATADVRDQEAPHGIGVAPGEVLAITRGGAGVPVVLIPGLFGSAFGFRKIVPDLVQAGFEVTVVEPLGVGSSGRPPRADYSLSAQADRIAEAMQRLGLTRAIVVGHAVGGTIALRLACRHSDRVSAVVSIEGGPAESAVGPGFRRAMKLAPLLRLFGGARIVRGQIRAQLADRSADPRWITPEVVEGYTRGATRDLGLTLAAFQRMASARERESLADRLAGIRCPVLLVLGAAPHEGGPTPAEVALLAGRVRAFDVVKVERAGNFVFEEAPAAVVETIARMRPEAGSITASEPSRR